MFAVIPICRDSRTTLFCSVYFSIIFYTTFLKKAIIVFSFGSQTHISVNIMFTASRTAGGETEDTDSVCCTSHCLQCKDYYYKIYPLTRTICKNRTASDLAIEDGTITHLLFCHFINTS
jgi:hypothetical protein